MVQGTASNTMVFEHSSAPASVKPSQSKTKYRDDETPLPLSSDPRVVRGSTTVLARKIAASKKNTIKAVSRSVDDTEFGRQLPRRTYQFEVKGHVGPDIDLTPYLIASDDGVSSKKKEVISQTDAFKDRPVTPEYVPRKTGVDGETQVEDVRELFDFDAESDPIVNVIVGKTLEQALIEVQYEEELTALESQALTFQEVIAGEKAWQAEKERETIAEMTEHRSELQRAKERHVSEQELTRLVAGSQMMRQILPGVFDNAVEDLYEKKEWRRPERATVEDNCYFPARDGLRDMYKANGESKKLVEELVMEASKEYEKRTQVLKAPVDKRCVLLHMRPPAAEVVEGEEDTKMKVIEPLKIYGRVSMEDLVATARRECVEMELPMYEALTVPALQAFFESLIGRPVAKDGAIMNFDRYIKDDDLFFDV